MKSALLLVTAVVFWALNFHLGKIMMEYVSPNTSAFWRYVFGVIALVFLTITKFPSSAQIEKNFKGIFLVGFIGLFGFIYFFFQGLKYTSAMNGALIIALNPMTTLIIVAIFQGYKIKMREVIGAVIAFVGVVYLLTRGNLAAVFSLEFNYGDLLFFLANILFALHNIWVGKYSKDLGNLTFTMLTSCCCLIGFSITQLWEPAVEMLSLPLRFWLAAIGMGFLGTALAYYCWNYGIIKIGATRGAVFTNAIPLFTAFFAILFGEQIFGFHWVSSLLIIGGLLLVQLKGKPTTNKQLSSKTA